MLEFLNIIFSQVIPFIPLAYAISISYVILQATDLTLDASFVLGAGLFAKLVTLNIDPKLAFICGVCAGGCAGIMTGLIQFKGKIDSLLAGILATFILTSLNLLIMGRPNINLLGKVTFISDSMNQSDFMSYKVITLYSLISCGIVFLIINSRFGLTLRALGENSYLLKRLGYRVELRRLTGFFLTNSLATVSGILTAQCVGYADLNMSLGLTLTGIGAIILGQHFLLYLLKFNIKKIYFEVLSGLVGILVYFIAMNALLKYALDPLYLKLVLGLILILFLRLSNGKRSIA